MTHIRTKSSRTLVDGELSKLCTGFVPVLCVIYLYSQPMAPQLDAEFELKSLMTLWETDIVECGKQ